MKTESVLLQNLCAPCACRCRYCLLCWDGKPVGVPWDRGARFALRFRDWMLENRPELRFRYTFGYAMEPPELREALRFLRRIGSPQAEYLQCDGLRIMEDIAYPDSRGRRIYLLPDGSYILIADGKEEVRGEAWLLADGVLSPL